MRKFTRTKHTRKKKLLTTTTIAAVATTRLRNSDRYTDTNKTQRHRHLK